MARSSHGAPKQLRDGLLQRVVRWNPDHVLDAPRLQGLVQLRLAEGGVGTNNNVPALLLLPFDLRQEHSFPVFSAVDVPRPQPDCQTVVLPIEQ